jgi:NADPH-dependent 2,4-dienoyl-CoA reductase/sulfur reductase-like enzyme/rhodanese-related sulfurtransferase
MARYIIVGGVAGGMSAAARLRRVAEKSEIIVVEKGSYVSYANCGLPYYIGDTIKQRDDLFVQAPESIARRFNVDVRINSEAVRINSAKKSLEIKNLATGEIYAERYDKLILSPGAEAVKPAISGIASDKIFTLRTIPDTDRIKAYVDSVRPKRALIVGAGYIGVEMAENLQRRGIAITMVEAANQVIPSFDYEMAALIHQYLKTRNIELYLNETASAFEENGPDIKTRLKSGQEIETDMVVLSIGVKPDIAIAKEAGLAIGEKGGIVVNEYLQTSDPDIYALGDAIEIINAVTGKKAVIPLAGPANKQGRIAADNVVFGNLVKYNGTFGTAIAKIFDMDVAVTGANEKLLKSEKIPCQSVIIHPLSHAGYYPNPQPMTVKILFSPGNGRILGAQCVGYEGIDKRIDMFAQAMHFKGTVYDLAEIEHAYAPPYSSAKDVVNFAGFAAENILMGKSKPVYWDEIDKRDAEKTYLVDVRTPEEFHSGTITGAVNIPVDTLRGQLSALPKDKEIIVFCRVGLRGYIAERILSQNGWKAVRNLSGGYITYAAATAKQENLHAFGERYDTGLHSAKKGVRKDKV